MLNRGRLSRGAERNCILNASAETLGSSDRYKIVYTCVAVKSRRSAGMEGAD